MPRHVVVDGSNLATEGRSLPSLKQLSDAVNAFIAENPTDIITVVVDATFGHRIDAKEVPEFEEAIEHNELVAPPAGAVGRGDAFVLSIANKVNATILTNDSYQEFHPDYPWLFDEGRLIGGKPVPNVGWVFVARTPVRGPVSRRATRESKAKGRGGAVDTRKVSKAASLPMPVPSAPPPGAVLPSAGGSRGRRGRGQEKAAAATQAAAAEVATTAAAAAAPVASGAPASGGSSAHVNALLPFISFVERHPVGTSVNAIVESYSSHGAYVTLGEVRGYVPLRLMADPAPRSAREEMKIGESVTLVVVSYAASRRSIDLSVPHLAHTALAGGAAVAAPEAAPKPAKRRAKATQEDAGAEAAPATRRAAGGRKKAAAAVAAGTAAAPEPAPRKRAAKKAAPAPVADTAVAETVAPEPAPKASRQRGTRKAAPAAPTPTTPAAEPAAAAPAAKKAARSKKAAAATGVVTPPAPAPVKKAAAPAKKAAKKAPAAAAPAPTPAPAPAAAKRTARAKAAPKAAAATEPVAVPAKKASRAKKAAAKG